MVTLRMAPSFIAGYWLTEPGHRLASVYSVCSVGNPVRQVSPSVAIRAIRGQNFTFPKKLPARAWV